MSAWRCIGMSKIVACCLGAAVIGLAAGRIFAAGEGPPPAGCVDSGGMCQDGCTVQPHTCMPALTGGCTPC